jgi:hypothetical protein
MGDAIVEYTYFHPELAGRVCTLEADRVVLAGSTFESRASQATARQALIERGLRKQSERAFEGPLLELYVR